MKTIALRFSDNFAPDGGTIFAHEEMIHEDGFVWYGKLGAAVSKKVINEILNNERPKILLIHSGKPGRYWAYVESIQHEVPEKEHIPEYYREKADNFRTWFKIVNFEPAPGNVLGVCKVASSQRPLSEVSRSSMSPYFVINVGE